MPKLRQRGRRADDDALVQLRALVHAGAPWLPGAERAPGFFDLYGLVRGQWYGPVLTYCQAGDAETRRDLWEILRADIMAEHVGREPFTRPSAWWQFDTPELRRVVGLDRDIMGDETDRLPAGEDPSLPEWAKGKTCFGAPAILDGFVYESQAEYLERLSLLTPFELAAPEAQKKPRLVVASRGRKKGVCDYGSTKNG